MENDKILYVVSDEVKTIISVGKMDLKDAWNTLSFLLPDLYTDLGFNYEESAVTPNNIEVVDLFKKKMYLSLNKTENGYKLTGKGEADNWDCNVLVDAVEESELVMDMAINTSENKDHGTKTTRKYSDIKWIKEKLVDEEGFLLHKFDCKKRELLGTYVVEKSVNEKGFSFEDIRKETIKMPSVKF